MATRITIKGQVTIPKSVRVALSLSPGDRVEFTPNGGGDFVVRKAQPPPALAPVPPRRERTLQSGTEEQMRRRAQELLELLRRLD